MGREHYEMDHMGGAVNEKKGAVSTSFEDTYAESSKAMHRRSALGTVDSYFVDGKQRLIPIPSSDPLDPLNMPLWRKWMCIFALCLFGSIGLSVQAAIAGMIPIFIFEYSGLNPKMLNGNMGPIPEPPPGPKGHRSADMSKGFPTFPGAPSAQKISMLGSLPSLFIGISNFISIPLAEAIGRRPVMLLLAGISFLMLPWAATSHSLNSHLASRCIQALGTGAVESLVPLIMQDLSFIHERNTFIALLWASGGLMGTVLGVTSSRIVANLSWRWFYWIMTIPGAIAFIMIFIFLPETKYPRSKDAIEGRINLPDGEVRPAIDYQLYGKKRWGWTVFKYNDWGAAKACITEMCYSLLLPNIVWIVLLNSIFIGTNLACQMTGGTVLLMKPYSFPMANAGLITLPLLVAGIFSFLISGLGGDWASLQLTKRNGGVREPEHQLINFIIPITAGVVGAVLFGYIGEYPRHFHWIWFFVANTIINYGFITVNSVASVYSIECYPEWAGSLLVMVTALRNVVSFGMSYGVFMFIDQQGFDGTFGIFGGLTGAIGLGLIPVWIYGKRIRTHFSAMVLSIQRNTL